MRYHWRSIIDCVPPGAVMEALCRTGFREISCRTELDLFRCYIGHK